MPILVDSVKSAVMAAHPEAVVAERWRNGIKHEIARAANGRKRFVMNCAIGSYHYLRDGVWRPINTDLVDATSGYAFANDTMAGRVLVGADGSRRVYPRAEDATAYVDFGPTEYWDGAKWQALAVAAPAKAVDRASWAADGVTVRLVIDADREKVEIVLRDDKAPTRFRWSCKLTGLRWDGWVLRNGRDEAVAEHLTPWLEDANGEIRAVVSRLDHDYFELEADCKGLAYPVVIDPPLDYQVGAGANDTSIIGTVWSNSRTTLTIGKDAIGLEESCSMLFTGVSGLSGVTITASYLTVKASAESGKVSVLSKISADDSEAPTTPTSLATFTGKTLTSAGVDWDAPAAWVINEWHNSPSLNTVIQELATSYNPSAVQIFHKDDGGATNKYIRYYAYETFAAYAPKLHIEYTAGGGADYPISLSGALTPGGTLQRDTGKPLAGALTPAGMVQKGTARNLSGAMANVGVVVTSRGMHRSFTGALGTAGTLAKDTGKPLAGALTPSGALAKGTGKPLSGALTSSGAIVKGTSRSLSGALTPVGTLAKETGKTLAGALGSSGSIIKGVGRAFAGGLTSSGALAKAIGRSLAGSLGSAGTLSKGIGKALAGALTSVGILAKGTARTLGGGLTSAGTLAKGTGRMFAGSLGSAGTLSKGIGKMLAGSLASTGIVTKGIGKAFSGALASVGDLVAILGAGAHAYVILLAGALGMSGALAKNTSKTFGGALGMIGGLLNRIRILLGISDANPYLIAASDAGVNSATTSDALVYGVTGSDD